MTEIVAGQYKTNEQSAAAIGGTEQMALRMVRDIDPDLLKPFQIIHSRVRTLEPNLKKILVCHDMANDPEVDKLRDPEYRKQFDKIVFVSNWQAFHYHIHLGIGYDEFVVIPNAIEPFPLVNRDYSGKLNLIYHTTPHRGLELLEPIFKALQDRHDLHLHVYSSFEIYGWKQRDELYSKLFDDLKSNPDVTYHGFKPNSEVREALKSAHLFIYPNIWPETSCLALIEAMSAGVFCVHPNYGALPETSLGRTLMYQWSPEHSTHASRCFSYSHGLISDIKSHADRVGTVAQNNQNVYRQTYEWLTIRERWNNLLRSLNNGTSDFT